MNRFEGQTILVTGAGSGIGAACVRRLVAEGANVVAGDVRKEDVDKLAAEFAQTPGRVKAVDLDITDRERVSTFVSGAIEAYGAVHGLVNSAGIRGVGNILDVEPDALRHVLSVNLEGTFNVCQAFARAVKAAKTPGAIVNLSSMAGIRGVANRLPYAASKFGIIGLSQTIALELAPFGIRVNAIAPGMIRTAMTEVMFTDPENARRIAADHPLGRSGEAHEIASVVAFLLSEDASFMTGAVIPVDGGKSVGSPTR